jgi:hypothetical protein
MFQELFGICKALSTAFPMPFCLGCSIEMFLEVLYKVASMGPLRVAFLPFIT